MNIKKLRHFTASNKTRFMLAVLPILMTGCLAGGDADNTGLAIHNARQTIDWTGTYQGMLPCSAVGCDGLFTMLVLYPGNTYTLRTRKMGQDIKDNVTEGRFHWLPDGSRIHLATGKEQAILNTLRIDRGQIILLDAANGDVLTDEQHNPFSLNKTGGLPTPLPTI